MNNSILNKTNEDVDSKPINKTLYWSNPLLILLLAINPLVFLIVLLVVRKKCRVTYFLSDAEKVKRRNKILIATLISLVSFATGIGLAMYIQEPAYTFACVVGVVGVVLGVAALVCAAIFAATLKITKVKGQDFWIRGAGPEFRRSLEV